MKYLKRYNEDINWDFDEEELPDEFIGHKDFYNFLKENGILNRYIENFEKRFSKFEKYDLKEFLNNVHESEYIDSFLWRNTPARHTFWSKIHKKWTMET